jgi:hypothetical protein
VAFVNVNSAFIENAIETSNLGSRGKMQLHLPHLIDFVSHCKTTFQHEHHLKHLLQFLKYQFILMETTRLEISEDFNHELEVLGVRPLEVTVQLLPILCDFK